MVMNLTWPPIEKGPGALKIAAADWRDFAVITTASPWALAAPHLPKPRTVILVTDLKRRTLDGLREQLGGVRMVVGVGSGASVDTAKYLAKVAQTMLAQVLTTSSNNACFTRTAWTFEDESRVPEREVPIPRQLVLDYDLLKQAPARLNRAGA